ncbi:unnamed protein product, partial [marine sediment metagenome]
DTIAALSEQNVGGETVEQRLGEYKSWDPEIFKVDKDTEDGYTQRLTERGGRVILISEEVGRVDLLPDASGLLLYAVSDPFDGSYLFKRGIPDFWYSSFAFYDSDFQPLTCAVGDGVHRKIAFASEAGAFIADLEGDQLVHRFKLDAEYRELMGRPPITDLGDASIESYAMKPKKFLMPLVDEYRGLLEQFKFFLPNGGPYGFVDVAEGKIDCYFARQQPFVEVFSGVLVAEQAGVEVSDFEGNPITYSDNAEAMFDVLVSSNPTLHANILEEIAKCKPAMEA